jgi:hypothetical protein
MVSGSLMTGELETQRFRYSVAPDCSATIYYRSGATPEEIFIHHSGDHFSWIDTRRGFVATGHDWRSSKRAPNRCSTATLKGTFAISSRGSTAPPIADPWAAAGMESFDGQGRWLGRYRTSQGQGLVLGGNYRIDADCIGQVSFDTGETYRIFVGPSGEDYVGVDPMDDFGRLAFGHKMSNRLLVTD